MNRSRWDRSWIGVIAALAVVVVAVGTRALADDKKDVAEVKPGLAKDLVGTWVLSGSPEVNSNPPGPGARLKFFNGTHWMITQPDPKTGVVVFHHGGRYTLEDDTMTTTTDFANENTADGIGKGLKFKVKVEGDTYTQVGLGNPWNETWKRVK